MNITFENMSRGIAWILSMYIISIDLFFFLGHFFVNIFGEHVTEQERIIVYVLVTMNLLSAGWMFLSTSKIELLNYYKLTATIILVLFFITLGHFTILYAQASTAPHEMLYSLQPLSIKTLLLVLVYGVYFWKSQKKR